MKKKNQSGVALIVVLFAVMLMTFLAVEIAYNTGVEYAISAGELDRLRAYYLAKTGVELSRLRIYIYKMALNKFGSQLGAQKNQLDMIWQFPFAWPPALPKDTGSDTDQDDIDAIVKQSYIEGSFTTSIEGLGSKININDLASLNQTVAQATNAALVQLIQARIQNKDDAFAQAHRDMNIQELINNIADWVDPDNDSRNGGDERSYYADTNPRINPPNRPIKTLDELHMVKGMTDDIYKFLLPYISAYGPIGINVNTAPKEVLESIDPQITDNFADRIITRRTDDALGPFQGEQDFATFLQQLGVNTKTFNQNKVQLNYDSESNFMIKSTGLFHKAEREIIAIVYDFANVKGQLSAAAPPPAQPANPNGTTTQQQQQNPPATQANPNPKPAAATTQAPSMSLTVPAIVLWQEDK